jgi:hypothetical protein
MSSKKAWGMKFTTLIPTTRTNGSPIKPAVLQRLIDALWRPFGGMTNEGYVTGHWIDQDGTEFMTCASRLPLSATAVVWRKPSRLCDASAESWPSGLWISRSPVMTACRFCESTKLCRPIFAKGVTMAVRKKTTVSPRVVAKAREVLAYAEQQARQAADWVELSNALFGLGGKATLAFPTERERTAFSKTDEFKRVLAVLDGLPAPPVKEFVELLASANGAISVRLPRTVHAALLAEARAEGVSLNQLCLAKLVAQLRAVI